jgi:hypothetical protein
MGGIYEVYHWDGLRCHDIQTKFHKDWFRHSRIDNGDMHAEHNDPISLLLFFSKCRLNDNTQGEQVVICSFKKRQLFVKFCISLHIFPSPQFDFRSDWFYILLIKICLLCSLKMLLLWLMSCLIFILLLFFYVDFHGSIGFSMHSTSIVSLAGSRQDKCVPWITGSGSSKSKFCCFS